MYLKQLIIIAVLITSISGYTTNADASLTGYQQTLVEFDSQNIRLSKAKITRPFNNAARNGKLNGGKGSNKAKSEKPNPPTKPPVFKPRPKGLTPGSANTAVSTPLSRTPIATSPPSPPKGTGLTKKFNDAVRKK